VQDGCDYSCSFCTIPLARGKSRSDTIENVLSSAREIANKGVKEIVLTGVNTGDFGIRDGRRKDHFIDLLLALENIEGIERFRISSIEPNLLSDEIIDFVSTSKRFMPHFHVPLQSGSDKILKLMRRRYLRALYSQKVEKIKSVLPSACIGVDVIVGFPGETHEDFLETYQFINELDISYLHVFTYSERVDTAAEKMDGIVSVKDRHERSKMLRSLSVKKRRYFYEQNLGKENRVLFENDIENNQIHGFSDNYIRIAVPYDPALINRTINVRMEKINDQGNVQGQLLGESLIV
jgi:threonylcarbamoyladenosine tRNA methylthiotransferase MtaB